PAQFLQVLVGGSLIGHLRRQAEHGQIVIHKPILTWGYDTYDPDLGASTHTSPVIHRWGITMWGIARVGFGQSARIGRDRPCSYRNWVERTNPAMRLPSPTKRYSFLAWPPGSSSR